MQDCSHDRRKPSRLRAGDPRDMLSKRSTGRGDRRIHPVCGGNNRGEMRRICETASADDSLAKICTPTRRAPRRLKRKPPETVLHRRKEVRGLQPAGRGAHQLNYAPGHNAPEYRRRAIGDTGTRPSAHCRSRRAIIRTVRDHYPQQGLPQPRGRRLTPETVLAEKLPCHARARKRPDDPHC